VVDVAMLASNPVDEDGDHLVDLAKKIDLALRDGADGVTRGPKVPVLEIEKVSLPEFVQDGANAEMTINIRAVDADGEERRQAIRHRAVLKWARLGRQERDSSDPVTFEVVYVSPECVVVTKDFTVKLLPDTK
jgi:hypothetical protein